LWALIALFTRATKNSLVEPVRDIALAPGGERGRV